MSYIGNTNTTQAFTPAIDYFSGNASTTAFTLSRPVASVAQVQVNISNVPQNPSTAYTVSGNTITFTSAPPSGTNNIYVYYTSPITQVIAPGQGTVNTTSLASSTGSGAVVLGTGPTITGAVMSSMASSVITSGTAQASTSGTSIDFTSIPSWVKRITVMFNGVSTNGTSNYVWQIGSGSIDTTANYSFSRSQNQNAGANNVGNSTTSTYGEFMGVWSSSATSTGHLILTNISGNSWVSSSNVQHISGTTGMSLAIGSKTLSGTLDRVRITTANGTDTFDAGSINILYE